MTKKRQTIHKLGDIKQIEKVQKRETKGLSLELEHPQYFVDGRGSLQAKKGR